MKIPSKLKVGGVEWLVRWDEVHMEDRKSWGSTNYNTLAITLSEMMPEDRESEVFLHELLHVAFATCDLAAHLPEGITEEEIVNPLAVNLFTLIRDNNLDFRKGKSIRDER